MKAFPSTMLLLYNVILMSEAGFFSVCQNNEISKAWNFKLPSAPQNIISYFHGAYYYSMELVIRA